MHFSSLGNPNDTLALKFQHAMRAAGYDVMHGCITAMLGTLTIMLVPCASAFTFGSLCTVMAFYGGLYALWCMPAVLILTDEAIAALPIGRSRRVQPSA
jgi:predicted RND superfamily exporter protein